jgi:two-component system osmolarity sensor histidine kinase EnvZ
VLDSLLKQNIAVLVATILGALFVSLVLIAGLVLQPQIERSASDTAQTIRNLELSFAQMDPFQQILFAEALRSDNAPGVLVADTAPQDTNAPRSWFTHYFLRVLTERYGIAASDVMVDTEGRVWTRIATVDQPYWLSLRTIPASDPVTGVLIAFGIALIAALAGGIALQRRIALPLKRLEESVSRLSFPSDLYDNKIESPREIAAVSRALTDMSERLQTAEADRALMLAGVSHDLRTPLTKLRLTLALLKDADAELIAGAERNVIRIEGMLGQFLDFARGFEAEETRAVSLQALLQQAIASSAEPTTVFLAEPQTDVMVQVKEAALLRAIDNLLMNAMRHGKPPITLGAHVQAGTLLIDVCDTGSGLSPDEVSDLVRPFARGNAARVGEGTGLGLAIVAQVARAHRGSVEFKHDAGTFTVRLVIPQTGLD